MNDLKREVECGLKAKYEQLEYHKKELEFYLMYEEHLIHEINMINYKLSLMHLDFLKRILKIKLNDLEKNKENIKSEEILIKYFEHDIEFYFKIKAAKKLDELRKV